MPPKKYFDEEFKYKHIVKLPWIALVILAVIYTWIFQSFSVDSFYDTFIRLLIFGVSSWFICQLLYENAGDFRRKVLFKDPELKSMYISQRISEWEEVTEDFDETH